MKNILLGIACLLSIAGPLRTEAQVFTTPYDTVDATFYGNTAMILHNDITNISNSPIRVSWKVQNHDFPASWTAADVLGICDNVNCYVNTNSMLTNGTSTNTTNEIPVNATDYEKTFYLSLDLTNAVAGTHYLTVSLKDNNSIQEKRITYAINKWATGVGSASRIDNSITLFPNPARNVVNVNFNAAAGIRNVAVYNLIGKMVYSYKVNAGTGKASLDISNIPSGIYYVRLQNAQGEVLATRRFTRQ